MKIALVQLNAIDKLWDIKYIPFLLELASNADLAVLPEGMPYARDNELPPSIEEAKKSLAELTKDVGKTALIAGGYVLENHVVRNAVFLSHKGKIKGTYFKRRLDNEPEVAPGGNTVTFSWDKHKCIPLICADAAYTRSPEGTRMMYEAIRHGTSKQVPIVVSSYSAWVNEKYWQEPLQTWSCGCGAPVLICAISGKGEEFDDEDGKGSYGGGGTGVFWPDERPPQQKERRGIYTVDINEGSLKYSSIPKD